MVVLSFNGNKVILGGRKFNINGTILSLEYTGIRQISGTIPDCVKYLYLGNNKIQDLSKLDVNKVSHFHINNNWIETLDSFDMKEISELNLNNNKIKSIDHFNVKNAKVVNIEYNRITEIIDFDPKYLHYLSLACNRIRRIKMNTKKLIVRLLKGNKLDSINELIIQEEIVTLNLSFNKITDIGNIYVDIGVKLSLEGNGMIDDKGEEITDSEMLNKYRDRRICNRIKSAKN